MTGLLVMIVTGDWFIGRTVAPNSVALLSSENQL
jgi:hypothetical protein